MYFNSYLILKVSALQVFSNNVQHPDHLREYKYPVSGLLQPDQELVQQQQLPTAFQKYLKYTDKASIFSKNRQLISTNTTGNPLLFNNLHKLKFLLKYPYPLFLNKITLLGWCICVNNIRIYPLKTSANR